MASINIEAILTIVYVVVDDWHEAVTERQKCA